MNTASSTCRDEPLRRLLEDAEQSAEYQAAARHVETCNACRRRLEELAAEQTVWLETQELLSEDETVEQFEREWRERSRSGIAHDSQASAISESLIRQYLAAPSHPEMLGRLGRYEIERWIGAGGMGIVLKGFDTELNRPVAIKVLAPHLAANGAARQRFAREARAAAAVVHEHVVAIHDVESEGPLPFLVMQYVSGESLQARLDRRGALDVPALLCVARQTAAGLAAAHAQGLVHRDVKPSNILLVQGVERALLTDFGLARASDDASLTHTGYLPGTPHYMSPEQARGESIDGRSDLFSLGSVLYAMATGRPPFRADTSFGVLRRITDTQPRPLREVNPDVPNWLAAVIDRLLAKQPDERCESAAELAAILEGCLAHVRQPDAVALPAEVERWTRAWQATYPARLASSSETRKARWSRGLGIGLGVVSGVAITAAVMLMTDRRGRNEGPADAQGAWSQDRAERDGSPLSSPRNLGPSTERQPRAKEESRDEPHEDSAVYAWDALESVRSELPPPSLDQWEALDRLWLIESTDETTVEPVQENQP
ncbi:MAG: serine/threonine-protein kinase [Pirellulales bacterium]